MKKILFITFCMVLCLGLFAQKWSSAYRFANAHQPVVLESPALNVVVIATQLGILHSADTGKTWDTAMAITGIKEMQCKGNNCYAITEKQLLRSTDKGASWSVLSVPMMRSNTINETMRVWSDAKVVLWIYDPNGRDSTFYTLDGGNSWINGKTNYTGGPVLIHTENTAFDLSFINPTVKVTQNKGSSYTNTSLETYRADYIIWNFLDSMVGYVSSTTDVAGDGATFAVKIRKTTDGGETWTGAPWTTSGLTLYEQNVSFPPEPQIHLTHFINESTGWFSAYYGNDNKFMKTIDSGRTWTADTLGWDALDMTVTGTVDVNYIKHMKMHSTDFGWALRRSTLTDTAVVLLKYGVGAQDTTTDTTGGSVTVNEITDRTVSVYPNPSASGIFTIQMSENSEGCKLKVIDITGREVGVVKENEVNLTTAKTGIYILVITAPDNTIWYQKLVRE